MERPQRTIEFGWENDGGVGERLVQQIIDGIKTATCGFKRAYSTEELAEVLTGEGVLYAAAPYGGEPRCVIRVTKVFETPFGDPDPRLVKGEGDGDNVDKFKADHRIAWSADFGDEPIPDDEPLMVELFEYVGLLD